MNHSKIILVAFISAFVAITTAVLGVTGTIIGSVLSSVLYNVLSEALEKPVGKSKFSTNFEWDIAYVFPLIVILIIQLMLIFAFLSEWGLLPKIFLRIYLSIQGVASNNLYRVLGFSLIVMSVYPFILKRDIVKKTDGLLILVVGLIFLVKGFSDVGSAASTTFDLMYDFMDFPLAIVAFFVLGHVIKNIITSARSSEKEFNIIRHSISEKDFDDWELKDIHRKKDSRNLDDLELKEVSKKKYFNQNRKQSSRNRKQNSRNRKQSSRDRKQNTVNTHQNSKINESINGIHFESNDLLDDYKK
ncbi:MAG: hypothetical protein K6A34_01585 [Methanobrevibacter sp.]|nr:hypothetical protein [Methanobrevibacter sp.]